MNLPTIPVFKIKEISEASRAFTLVVPVGSIIISLLIVGFVIWPKINEILALQKDNEQLAMQADSLEKKASILAGLDKNKLEEQLIAAEQLLPSDKNVFSVLRQVEVSASQSGILLNKVEAVAGTINEEVSTLPAVPIAPSVPTTPTTPTDNPVAGAIPSQGATFEATSKVQVRLSTTSDYTSLLKFLSNIYAFSRVVNIDGISLSPAIGESLQIRSSFSIDAYWKTLPLELGSIESPISLLTNDEEQLLVKVLKPEAIQAPTVPTVPVGRNDLFTPF